MTKAQRHPWRQPSELDDLFLYHLARLMSSAGTMVVRLCEGGFGITADLKVEVPGQGDLARQLGADPSLNRAGMGASFLAQNAGKRSVTMNLKRPAGREAFRRLVATADVVVENFRPGVMERLGLGYEALQAGAFDVCALDHYKPGREGLDVLPDILALPTPPPVVYVTGAQEGRIAVAALRAGAADYVIKDVSEDFTALLRAALEDALLRRRA